MCVFLVIILCFFSTLNLWDYVQYNSLTEARKSYYQCDLSRKCSSATCLRTGQMSRGMRGLPLLMSHHAMQVMKQAIGIGIDWEDARGKGVAHTRVLFATLYKQDLWLYICTMKWKAESIPLIIQISWSLWEGRVSKVDTSNSGSSPGKTKQNKTQNQTTRERHVRILENAVP